MNTKNGFNKMFPEEEIKLSSLQKSFSTNQSRDFNNMKLSNTIIQTRRSQQNLPQIISPFLKNIVTKMFSQPRLKQLKPIIRQPSLQQKQQIKIQKSKSQMKSIKTKINRLPLQNQIYKQTSNQTKQFVNSHLLPMKIPKSYSESKKNAGFVESGYLQLKKSLDLIQNIRNKTKQKSLRSSRSNSEESEHKEESSKNILKKLQQLHQKQTQINSHYKDTRTISLPKTLSKEIKSPSFVVRHKMSRQMFAQQKQQIQLLTKAIENFKGLNLTKEMKVKNYSNFLPQIIIIDS